MLLTYRNNIPKLAGETLPQRKPSYHRIGTMKQGRKILSSQQNPGYPPGLPTEVSRARDFKAFAWSVRVIKTREHEFPHRFYRSSCLCGIRFLSLSNTINIHRLRRAKRFAHFPVKSSLTFNDINTTPPLCGALASLIRQRSASKSTQCSLRSSCCYFSFG